MVMLSRGEAGQWGDGLQQVVPDAGCGNTERPVADRPVTCPQNDEGRGRRKTLISTALLENV